MLELRSRCFSSVYSFSKKKFTINGNISFTDCASQIRLLGCSKLTVNWKYHNEFSTFRRSIIVTFFWRCHVSLVKFSYWSKFHVNIITGSVVVTIFFYKGLPKNPEIRNTPDWVFPDLWKLGRVRNTKFDTNVSNKMLLSTAKCQGYMFYRFWVTKRKPTGGKIAPAPQIRVKSTSSEMVGLNFPSVNE